MAIPGYMWITDENENIISSNVKIKGRENSAEILAFNHEVRIPSDEDTGILTGTRKHEPLRVTKSFCSASPILNKACCSGKTLKEVKISWYQINEDGQEQEYFRHTLTNAKIVSVKPIVDNVKEKAKERYGHLEEVAFRYEKIIWHYLNGNITAEDDWNQK